MKEKVKKNRLDKIIWKFFSGIIFYFSIAILVFLLFLQLPPVQTQLAKSALSLLKEKTEYDISIDKLKISWLNQVGLEGFLIKDLDGDTLSFAKSFEVSYKVRDLLRKELLHVKDVRFSDLMLNLSKEADTSQFNVSIFLNSFKSSDNTNDSTTSELFFEEIEISNFKFRLRSPGNISKEGLDFNNMNWLIEEINLRDFSIGSDTIAGNLNRFVAKESNSQFQIDDIKSNFYFSNQSLSLDDLSFITPTSHIGDSLEFFYNGFDDLSHFVDSVTFILHFEKSVISALDLQNILGSDALQSDIAIDGIIWGQVGDFNIEDSFIGFGERTFIRGGVSCFGLPNIKNTFILADLTNARLSPNDISPYLKLFSRQLEQTFGDVNFNGSFAGYPRDFVARADFHTPKGDIKTDINLKIPEDPSEIKYSGSLELIHLNLESLFENQYINEVNMIASVKGEGINLENAHFNLNALAFNTKVNGYEYDTIRAVGDFSEKFFNGEYEINDPNLLLKGDAQLDFTSDVEVLQIDFDLDTLNSDTLNLATDIAALKTKLKIDVYDLDLDNFNGSLSIDSTILLYNEKKLLIDSVRFFAAVIDSTRILNFSLPGFTSNAFGKFKLTDLIKDIPAIVNGYKAKLLLPYDSLTEGSDAKYKVEFAAQIEDVNDYLNFLDVPIKVGGNTFIEASVRQSKNSNISFFLESDALAIGSSEFVFPTIDINASKGRNDKNILTDVLFESFAILIPGIPTIEEVFLEAVWFKNNIELIAALNQEKTNSDIRLNSNIELLKDSIAFHILPSDITLFDQSWGFDPSNMVTISNESTKIKKLEMKDTTGEMLAVNGIISDTSYANLTIKSENLNINKVNLFAEGLEVEGFFNSEITINKSSWEEETRVTGDLEIDDFYYDNVLIGDVVGVSRFDPSDKVITSNLNVKRKDIEAITVGGKYYPGKEEQLDFDVTFNQASLLMVEPFLRENVSYISGFADGTFKVTGSTSSPEIDGDFNILGDMTIDYLNTTYHIDGKMDIKRDKIVLRSVQLIDRKGSEAKIRGEITHSGFSDVNMAVNLFANNFEFLNTTKVDNELYYGSAYGSGEILISGPISDLNIEANIKTEKNTKFFIPVSETASVEQESYITFVNFSDTVTQLIDEKQDIGFNIAFNIEVTDDAYCELIFDIRTGNIIKGSGNGNLKLNMTKDGEFTMFGPLSIEEGSYNFTMANLVNKQFDVIPGSRITWSGDPYNALLDLEASYLQRASLDQLEAPSEDQQANSFDKVPFLVILLLNGEMGAPDIDFDIRFEDPSSVSEEDKLELKNITNDDQELNRQFMSLLLLKKFSPKESFALGSGGGIGSSFSEFITNQMSYLISQLDENLEVELDLASLNNEDFNTLQVRLAYTFLDGRLKVTSGGGFGSGQEEATTSTLTSIVGDWSLEYSITPDSKLRIKVFQNTNDQITNFRTQQAALETGVSLKFVHSFNSFIDLLTLKREEAIIAGN